MKTIRFVLFFVLVLLVATTPSKAEISNGIADQEQTHLISVSNSTNNYHPVKRHKQRKHRHGLRHKRAIVVIRRRFR